jgi:RimJ/RimL family protein N-acetyltransferase
MTLETRESPNGSEKWLNWVARPSSGEPIGFVQATVNTDHHANIAYVFSSQHWGQGLAFESVEAMIAELVDQFKVNSLSAVLKTNNVQSLRLLERLNFALAALPASIEADEIPM